MAHNIFNDFKICSMVTAHLEPMTPNLIATTLINSLFVTNVVRYREFRLSLMRERAVSSIVARCAANRWVRRSIPVTGKDILGPMVDSCFILCHKCPSSHCCVGSHVY